MRNWCAYCGARINPRPTDGTDPSEADGSWSETYECENGHTGTLRWESDSGYTATGALKEDQRVIADD